MHWKMAQWMWIFPGSVGVCATHSCGHIPLWIYVCLYGWYIHIHLRLLMAMASQMRLEVGEWGYVGISVVVAHKYSGTNTVADGESDTDTRTHAHKGKVGGADDSIRCVCVPFFMRSMAIQNAYFKSSAKMNRSEATTTSDGIPPPKWQTEHRFVLLHSGFVY